MTSILNVPPSFWGGLAKGSAKGSAFVSVGASRSPSRSAPFLEAAARRGRALGALVMPEKIGSREAAPAPAPAPTGRRRRRVNISRPAAVLGGEKWSKRCRGRGPRRRRPRGHLWRARRRLRSRWWFGRRLPLQRVEGRRGDEAVSRAFWRRRRHDGLGRRRRPRPQASPIVEREHRRLRRRCEVVFDQ